MAKQTNISIQTGDNTSENKIYAAENIDVGRTSLLGDYIASGNENEEGQLPVRDTATPSPLELHLFQIVRDKFDLEGLENICWELGIKSDDLSAKALTGKARQLVERATVTNTLGKLAEIVKRERPGIEIGDA